ncbi:MAG: biotin--[acetyl-CoA-carboxylase] ligase [Anaerolineales bacterium]|nr:biotin--[acetyl-CoA-carboxylase] ligase [Anaerolineales bacterium]
MSTPGTFCPDMNEKEIKTALREIPLGGFRFYQQIGSTNDTALAWATEGAPDHSLVVADEQLTGRGRAGNTWYTPPGAALALSLILRPSTEERNQVSLFTALGALAVCKALKEYGLPAEIKWPNDVLIQGKKVAGVLVETVWMGIEIESLILGIGLNVLKTAVPTADKLSFEATSLEHALNHPVDRIDLIPVLIRHLIEYRSILGSETFLLEWQQALAFSGHTVLVWGEKQTPTTGKIVGLGSDGRLVLETKQGELVEVHFGEVHLRPANH